MAVSWCSVAATLASSVAILGQQVTPEPSVIESKANLPAWTVMVYMNANNNLEPWAFKNFAAMAKVEDTPNVNVLVFLGRHAVLVNSPSWVGSLKFKMKKDLQPEFEDSLDKQSNPKLVELKIPDLDFGDPATLEGFVSWAMKAYPAEHYMLVLWDHGDGWRAEGNPRIVGSAPTRNAVIYARNKEYQKVTTGTVGLSVGPISIGGATSISKKPPLKGPKVLPHSSTIALPGQLWGFTLKATKPPIAVPQIAPDSTLKHAPFRALTGDDYHGGSVLYNRDIQDSLRKVLHGKKLDVIGFDACLMAMIETAYGMRSVAEVMVGSEELEPGIGWPYDQWLSALHKNPSMTAKDLAKTLVDTYKSDYIARSEPTATLSAIDLSRIQQLADSLDSLTDQLQTGLRYKQHFNDIRLVREMCICYGAGYGMQGVDLGCLSKLLIYRSGLNKIRDSARAVESALADSVISQWPTEDRSFSNGLAIYFPSSNAVLKADTRVDSGYDKRAHHPIEFVQDRRWPSFIEAYCKQVPK